MTLPSEFRRRIHAGLLLASIAAFAVSLPACDDELDPGAADASKARKKLAPIVAASCDWLFDCCAEGERGLSIGSFVDSAPDCTARVLSELEAGSLTPASNLDIGPASALVYVNYSLDQRRVRVIEDEVDACAAAIASETCNEATAMDAADHCVPGEDIRERDTACALDKLFEGRQKPGEACNPDVPIECEPGSTCVPFGDSGVCAIQGQQGVSCFADAACSSPLICDYAKGSCQPGAGAGQACSYINPDDPKPGTEKSRCEAGLLCNPDSETCVPEDCGPGVVCARDSDCPEEHICHSDSSRCASPGESSSVCNRHEECESNYCHPATSSCQPQVDMGDDCSEDAECLSEFCDAGVCTARAEIGDTCESGDDRECASGYCDASTVEPECRAFAGLGDACDNAVRCDPALELRCIDDACRELPLEDGLPCASDTDCSSRVCFDDFCSAGAAEGDSCGEPDDMPCAWGNYCKLVDEGLNLSECTAIVSAGEGCESDEDCWGECIVAFGRMVCDETAPMGKTYCDGA